MAGHPLVGKCRGPAEIFRAGGTVHAGRVCGGGGGGVTESKQLRNQPTKAYRNEMEHEREQGLQTWLRAVGGVRAPPTDRTRPCRWESQGVAGKNKSVPCAVFSIVGNYVRLQ